MGLNYLPSPAIIQQFFWPIMTLIICVQTYKKFGLVAKIGVGTFFCLIYRQNVKIWKKSQFLSYYIFVEKISYYIYCIGIGRYEKCHIGNLSVSADKKIIRKPTISIYYRILQPIFSIFTFLLHKNLVLLYV